MLILVIFFTFPELMGFYDNEYMKENNVLYNSSFYLFCYFIIPLFIIYSPAKFMLFK